MPDVAAVVENVTLRGGPASITWGYRTAADLTSWTISKKQGVWKLVAKPRRVDDYQIKQVPLLFNAPRVGGFWSFPIEEIHVYRENLVASLGPPVS